MANNKAKNKEIPEEIKQPYSINKIIFLVIAVIVVIIIIYLVIPKATNCDYDKACFIEKANNCERAIVRDTIGDGSIVKYTSKDCILTKAFDEFSETEPEEVTSFFEKKEMTCSYTQGNFDPVLVESLPSGIDDCEGELKDAILELRIAQLTLS